MKTVERLAFALLVLLTFTIPWEKSIIIPGLGTFTKLVGIAAFATACVRTRFRPPNLALVAAGGFVLYSALTWFWSYDPPATLTRSLTLVQLLLMMWLVWEQTRTAVQSRMLLGAYVLGAVLASFSTFARYASGVQTYYKRYAAPGFDPNDLGLTVALAIPPALYLARTSWFWRIAVAICGAAVLLTASRTALICSITAFVFVPLTWRVSTNPVRFSGLALLVLLLAGAVALAPKEARQRIATIGSEVKSGTLHKRTTIWRAGISAWKSRKLTGVGSGAYPRAVEPILGVPGVPGHEYVAHNTFLSVLVETGLTGFVLYAAFLLVLVIFALVQPQPDRALWVTVLLVWAIGVSTLTWEHRKAAWILFALLTAGWARAFRTAESA